MLRLLNYIPIAHVSCDERYGDFDSTLAKRFSILALNFGAVKIYVLSARNWKFEIFKILRIDNVCAMPTQYDIDAKTGVFATSIANQTPLELDVQYEFLKESYNNYVSAKSSIESRISSHLTVYFFVMGFYAFLLGEILKLKYSFLFLIVAILYFAGILFLLSTGILIWSAIKVRGIVRAMFKDLRASPTLAKRTELAYTNWYAARGENFVLASLVKNLESALLFSVLIAVTLWFVAYIGGGENQDKIRAYILSEKAAISQWSHLDGIKVPVVASPLTVQAASSPSTTASNEKSAGLNMAPPKKVTGK
ncbi:hypothetical protein [Paraburkholderia sediminicola]|uniref:hypothetical protein n=1 Tax=Paraburkholderia sediminicola TaxID=458836 RepID=UPI0038BA6E02